MIHLTQTYRAYYVTNVRIHRTKCEMLVSLVPGGSLSLVAVCQVSHKLASTRDARVIPGKGRIMKEPPAFDEEEEKRGERKKGKEQRRDENSIRRSMASMKDPLT